MAIFSAIGGAIASALFASAGLAASTLATIGSVIGGALAFGTQLAFSYINRPKKRKYSAIQGETQYGGDIAVNTLYGIGKTKGQRIFYAKHGGGNKFNSEVFVLANGWCDGLQPYVYFYGKKQELVTRPIIGNEVAHWGVAGFGSLISIRFYDGRPGQAVDQKLVNDTFGLGQTWKGFSVAAGLCYVVVTREYNSDLFPTGKPDIDFVLRGLREYDPRKDSTVAGGSGPQRLNDPVTWVHTVNPAVHRFNYQLGLRALVSGRTLIGEGKSVGQLDLGTYFAAMNVCDSLRKGKPTYQCSLFVSGEDDHTEILKEFDDAMAGYGLNRRGLSGVIPGAPQVAVLEITEDDLAVDRPKEIQLKKSALDRFNHLNGQFMSIEAMWNPQSLKPVVVNADIAADGRNKQATNDFLQVTDPDIAQYLLNIRYRQNRKGGTATIPVSRRVGLKVQEGEWVIWRGMTWMIENWSCDEQFRITLKLNETGADIYDDGNIAPGPIIIPPTPVTNPSIISTVSGLTVTTGMLIGADGFQQPELRFTWTPPEDPTITEVIIEYRKSGDLKTYTFISTEPESGEGYTTANVISGVFYNARATIRTVPARFSTYTAWVTSLNITGNASVYVDVNLEEIEASLAWVRNVARTATDAIDQILASILEDKAVAFQDKQTLRREISTSLGAAQARYLEEIQVAVSATSAVAAKVESLTASLGGNSASVNVAWAAAATEAGYAASYQLQAAVNDGQFRSASFGLNVPANPSMPSQIIMDAEQFILRNGPQHARPFVVQDGIAYLDQVKVNSLDALSSTLGNVDISEANIGNLTVGTSNIDPGAVTEYELFDQEGTIDSPSSAMTTIAQITVEHGLGSPNIELLYAYNIGIVSTGSTSLPNTMRQLFEVVETGQVFLDTTSEVGAASQRLLSVPSVRVKNYTPAADRESTTFRVSMGNRGNTTLGRANLRLLRALVMKR